MAVELGFADEIMKRSADTEDIEVPQVSNVYSRMAVTNHLMDKIAAKCRIEQKPKTTADSLMERLNLIKNWR